MTNRKVLDAMLDNLIASIAEVLEPKGFERRGKVVRGISDGSAKIIEFQKSDKSSDNLVLFTINVGIVCGDLLDAGDVDVKKSTIVDAHLRCRLGMLSDTPGDAWWELTAASDWSSLARELSVLLVAKAVPFLEKYARTELLIALWESGRSPGLTNVQRSRFLSELKSKKRGVSH